MKWINNLLSDSMVMNRYVRWGSDIGDAESYSFMGEPSGMKSAVRHWAFWERLYADKGYRTISLDDFIDHGGYGKNIDHLKFVRRAAGEEPIYHAETYKERLTCSYDHKGGFLEALLKDCPRVPMD